MHAVPDVEGSDVAGSDVAGSAARAATIEQLRRKLAAVPGGAPQVLPVPEAMTQVLPQGGLPRGGVVELAGATSLLTGLVAAVTGEGLHAAIVGRPTFGVLAAAEMGARLERLAVIPDPGPDPVEVASVLLDGMDLVVLDFSMVARAQRTVAPSRARVLAARARSRGSTLMISEGRWPGADLSITGEVAGYGGLAAEPTSAGRIASVDLSIEARGRTARARRAHIELCTAPGGTRWRVVTPVARAVPGDARDLRAVLDDARRLRAVSA